MRSACSSAATSPVPCPTRPPACARSSTSRPRSTTARCRASSAPCSRARARRSAPWPRARCWRSPPAPRATCLTIRADVTITAIELSPEMAELGRQRAAELGREIDLRVGDAEQLEFPDESFDTVVCTFGLCTIPDDAKAVREAKRVLRPGGLLAARRACPQSEPVGAGDRAHRRSDRPQARAAITCCASRSST